MTAMHNDVTDDGDDDGESNVTSSRDHMSMSFMMGRTRVQLDLEKNDNIPQLLSYYTAENGRLVQWTVDERQVKLLTSVIDRLNNFCGRDGRTICGPQRLPKSTCVSL